VLHVLQVWSVLYKFSFYLNTIRVRHALEKVIVIGTSFSFFPFEG
jgi:hypothetical protein